MRKKYLSFILATLLICCFAVTLVGCNNKNKKYDVSIKVVCEEVNKQGNLTGDIVDEIIFTPDISEASIELGYTGRTYVCYVYQYNLPNHPQFSDNWFTPDSTGADVFESSLSKVKQYYYEESPKAISDIGEYIYIAYAEKTSKLWNPRTIKLYITVT